MIVGMLVLAGLNVPIAIALGLVAMPASASALSSSAASRAIIIPRSIPMSLYAVTAQTSVVKMFVAAIIPGIIGAAGLAVAAYIQAVRYDFPVEEQFQLARVRQTFKEA